MNGNLTGKICQSCNNSMITDKQISCIACKSDISLESTDKPCMQKKCPYCHKKQPVFLAALVPQLNASTRKL